MGFSDWKSSSKITFFICITVIIVASMAYGYFPELIEFGRDLITGIFNRFFGGGVKV